MDWQRVCLIILSTGKIPLSGIFKNKERQKPIYIFFLNFNTEMCRALYDEDFFVNYMFYEKFQYLVEFPFQHGLFNTAFE